MSINEKNKALIIFLLFFVNIVSCAKYKCNFKLYDKSLSKDEIVSITIDKDSRIDIISIDNEKCLCKDKIRINPGKHILDLEHHSKQVKSSIYKFMHWSLHRKSLLEGSFKSGHTYILKFEVAEGEDIVNFPGEEVSFNIIRAWIEDTITREIVGETFFGKETSQKDQKKLR